MKEIELETILPADASKVWAHICQSRLLAFVTRGLMRFEPFGLSEFPEHWRDGEYKAQKYLYGWLPIGWQIIRIEHLPDQGQKKRLRDNGSGWLIPVWDHVIEVEPVATGTRYVDRVRVDAGILTPFVAAFSRRFYAHRQRRLHKLVAAHFNYELE